MTAPNRALFFDFGGTLFSYTGVHGRAFMPILLESLERLGVEVEARQAGRAYRKASAESFREFNPKPYYLHKELFLDTYRRFGQELGADPKDDFLEWFYQEQREMFYAGCKLREDCLDTLNELRDRGCYLSIVSNIDDDYLHPMVERTGLHEVLHHWTSSEEARSCKPHAGIFELAMAKAGIDAERVIFVGDSAHHDVGGASKLGMRTVLIQEEGVTAPGTTAENGEEPHHTIRELAELLEIADANLPR
jgi:HAD superfamily hydrolase (TIGR01509 family)